MEITEFLLILNIISSILHPIKYIPQIIHTIKTKKVEDLSKVNIICELILNMMHLTSFSLIYIYIGQKQFFIPIIVEKVTSTIFIGSVLYLKNKYTVGTYNFEEIKPIPIPYNFKYNTINEETQNINI